MYYSFHTLYSSFLNIYFSKFIVLKEREKSKIVYRSCKWNGIKKLK